MAHGARHRPPTTAGPPRTPRPRAILTVDGEADARRLQSARAARLMDLLGLTDDELCEILAVDPLTLLSGQIEHRAELAILLTLLDEAGEGASPAVLQRWVRTQGPSGRPLDALRNRDFAAFEDALGALSARGFVIRGGGDG